MSKVFSFQDAEKLDYEPTIQEFRARYSYLGEGRHRIVFRISPRNVVKVPLNPAGVEDNWSEHSRFRAKRLGYPMARCRIHRNFFLVMEYIKYLDIWFQPKWATYVDCQQVGISRDGKIKAYDYGVL